jgi:hypothetical protein
MISEESYVIFSKYKTHTLPKSEEDLHNGFFSFMAQYAVRHGLKVLLAKVATMSSAFDQNIDLPLAKSEEEQAGGDIVRALAAVRQSIQQGKIDVIRKALEAATEYGLQTKDTLEAQKRLFQLEAVRDRLKNALEEEEAQEAEEALKKCREIGLEDDLLVTAEDRISSLIVHGGGVSRRGSKDVAGRLQTRKSSKDLKGRASLTALVDEQILDLKRRESKKAHEAQRMKDTLAAQEEALAAHMAKATVEAAHARALAVRLEASEAARAEAEAELAALRAEVAVLRSGNDLPVFGDSSLVFGDSPSQSPGHDPGQSPT